MQDRRNSPDRIPVADAVRKTYNGGAQKLKEFWEDPRCQETIKRTINDVVAIKDNGAKKLKAFWDDPRSRETIKRTVKDVALPFLAAATGIPGALQISKIVLDKWNGQLSPSIHDSTRHKHHSRQEKELLEQPKEMEKKHEKTQKEMQVGITSDDCSKRLDGIQQNYEKLMEEMKKLNELNNTLLRRTEKLEKAVRLGQSKL